MDNQSNMDQVKYFDHPEPSMKLTSSVSDQNTFFTYVCLINNVRSRDSTRDRKRSHHSVHLADSEDNIDRDQLIQVERSKALHELVESKKKDKEILFKEQETDPLIPFPTRSHSDDCTQLEIEDTDCADYKNPNVLKLTKMKWLTEDQEGSPDSRHTNALTGARLKGTTRKGLSNSSWT